MRDRDPEDRHYRVADVVLDHPTVALDHIAHAAKPALHRPPQRLGIDPLSHRRRSHNVGKDHRDDLAPLTTDRRHRHLRSARGAKPGTLGCRFATAGARLHVASLEPARTHPERSLQRDRRQRSPAAPASVQREQRRADCPYPCNSGVGVHSGRASPFVWSQQRAPRPSTGTPEAVACRADGSLAHRWLAKAEANHGGAILRRRAQAHRLGAGAAAANEVDARGPLRAAGARPGKDAARAGGGGHVLRRSLRSLRRVIRRQDAPAAAGLRNVAALEAR